MKLREKKRKIRQNDVVKRKLKKQKNWRGQNIDCYREISGLYWLNDNAYDITLQLYTSLY